MTTVKINQFCKNGKQVNFFERYELQRLMGISNRGVFRKWLIACGYNPDDKEALYTWKDLEMLCCLKLFLDAKTGYRRHTYYQFFQLREKKLIFATCRMFKLRPRLLLEQIKHDYYSQSIAS